MSDDNLKVIPGLTSGDFSHRELVLRSWQEWYLNEGMFSEAVEVEEMLIEYGYNLSKTASEILKN